MAKIDREQVKELAKLARLGLSEEEEVSLVKEMAGILEYVSELDSIDTASVAVTSQVTGLENVMAEDVMVRSDIRREDLLANAPALEDGFIKVKKVLE